MYLFFFTNFAHFIFCTIKICIVIKTNTKSKANRDTKAALNPNCLNKVFILKGLQKNLFPLWSVPKLNKASTFIQKRGFHTRILQNEIRPMENARG